MTPAALRALPRRELARIMAGGRRVDPALLDGWIYRGITLGLPAIVERLTWTKFAKVFQRDPGAAQVRGWNVRIEQDGLDRPWRPQQRRGAPVTFGHFVVDEADGVTVLDYRVDRVLRVVRDPVVALDDRADVLVGRSLVELAGVSLGTPAYFVLERDHRVGAPW